MNLPTLRQLEYVVALADAGTFVEAARRCAVSQPALSKQVREVEDLLGVELFERTRPAVLPTAVGREIVARARLLLRSARDLVDVAESMAGGHPRTVRLGVIPTIAPYGLPGLLARLRELHPSVRIAVHELQTPRLLEHLRSGEVDAGLLAHPFDTTGLIGADIVFEPFVLVAPEGHALAAPAGVRGQDIAGESLILMQDGHCLRDQAIDVCARAGAPPATAVEAASVTTLTRMVESGLGATLLPASAIAAEVHPGMGIVVRGFVDPVPGRTVTLQWRSASPFGVWFESMATVLREHYLSLARSVPPVHGPCPAIRLAEAAPRAPRPA